MPRRPTPHHRTPARLTLALLACGAAGHAAAQLSGSLTMLSDNRFRGVSLSDGQPDLRLGLAADGPGGWYAGASLSRAALWPGHRRAQWLGYAGHSRRLENGLTWDAGITALHFADGSAYDYAELQTGLIGERFSARVHVSPDYFGRSLKSLYAELDAHAPFAPGWQALAHVGVLAVNANDTGYDSGRTRPDWRVGAAWSGGPAELQLAWVGAGQGGPYPAPAYGARRSGWVLSASVFF